MKSSDLQRKFKSETGFSVEVEEAKNLSTSGFEECGGMADDIESIISKIEEGEGVDEIIKELRDVKDQVADLESGADDFTWDFKNKFYPFVDYVNWLEEKV